MAQSWVNYIYWRMGKELIKTYFIYDFDIVLSLVSEFNISTNGDIMRLKVQNRFCYS